MCFRLRRIVFTGDQIFSKLCFAKGDVKQAKNISPASLFASSRPAIAVSNQQGKRKEEG